MAGLAKYSILDTETTGLFPSRDRVIELAIIQLDAELNEVSRFESLFNPKRDLGPVHIHGIRGSDVAAAPSFADMAEQLVRFLADTVLVGHNLQFDLNFLNAELDRVGREALPSTDLFCTLTGIKVLFPSLPRKLELLAQSLGVAHKKAHSAISDVEATAQLFAFLQTGNIESVQLAPPEQQDFPLIAQSIIRPTEHFRVSSSYIQTLVESLPVIVGSGFQNEYLATLEESLADYSLSDQEISNLLNLAIDLGMSVEDAAQVHSHVFSAVINLAWADNQITEEESEQIRLLGNVLGISGFDIESAIKYPPAGESLEDFLLGPGAEICLTGTMVPSKAEMRKVIQALGFVCVESVTKKTSLLISADASSMSGKAAKARQYAIPIRETDFLLRMLNG